MTPESRNGPLLDNDSLGTFPQERLGLWGNQTVATKLTYGSAATVRLVGKPDRCYEVNIRFRSNG
jgi:hypothetical protein